MKNMIYSFIVLSFFMQSSFAQISFIGFEQTQCGLISDHGYTFENISMMCGSHSSGYKIYKNGDKVFEKCIDLGGCTIIDLLFINETMGFIIERNTYGHTIYKTINSGVNWNSIGHGAPTFLGLFLANANTGYLATTWDSPKAIYLQRISDINPRLLTSTDVTNDTIISDTIFGNPFCEMDTIAFKIKNDNDTVTFKIVIYTTPLSIIGNRNKANLKLFPNPVDNYIVIKNYEFLNGDFEIAIFDYSGNIIKFLKSNKEEIFIGDLKPGLYLLRISYDDNTYINKFIKN